MKILFVIIFLSFFAFLSFANHIETVPPPSVIDERKNDIYYVNGMLTAKSMAEHEMDEYIQEAIIDDVFNGNQNEADQDISNWVLNYNDSGLNPGGYGAIEDIWEVAIQYLGYHLGIPGNTSVSFAGFNSQPAYPELIEHLTNYRNSIASGHSVIVVAHSQGNLYTNATFNYLLDWEKNYFHRLSLASPVYKNSGGIGHIFFDNDIVGWVGAHGGEIINPIRHLTEYNVISGVHYERSYYQHSPIQCTAITPGWYCADDKFETSIGFHQLAYYFGFDTYDFDGE